MEWYVARGGQTYGPFSLDVMRKGVRDGELLADDFVWSATMPDWSRASQIPDLWGSQTDEHNERNESGSASESVEPVAVAPSTNMAGVPTSSNFIIRHWRGELSLGRSYWLVGCFANIGLILLGHAVGKILAWADFDPRTSSALFAAFLAFVCVFVVWQVVGIWRSAGRHIDLTGRRFWAIAARLVVILSTIRGGVDFTNIIWPMFSEFSKVAIGVDDTPAHELRLLRGATEVELSGGMPFGTASALKTLLDAAPTVKVIHLNSFGGRVSEGYEIYKLIRGHQLITYTSTNCVSACTIAFLAGAERLLASEGKLGFHSANLGGLDERVLPEINDNIRQTLREHGVAPWFIEKSLSTRGDSVWYPTHGEMLEAKVVTKIVDSDQFGLSGIGGWKDRDTIERRLGELPVFAVIKENDPEGFKVLASQYSAGVQAGRSINEIVRETQATLTTEVLPKYLQRGPDLELVAYWKTQIREMEYLEKSDARRCVEYLFPELRQNDYSLTKFLPEALIKDDIGSLGDLIRATVRNPIPEQNVAIGQDIQYVIDRITAVNPEAIEVLREPRKYAGQPMLVCSTLMDFYKQILMLPVQRSGPILREIVSK
jgi:hypothetical protein